MKKNQKGFTLIELLVVIAIIGLLSTLAVVSLNNARAKSRDAKRISDIKQVQTALELYYNDVSTYPAAVAEGGTIDNAGTTYMAVVPENPTPNNDGDCPATTPYAYTQDASGASYSIVYCIGGATGGLDAGTHTATPAGLNN